MKIRGIPVTENEFTSLIACSQVLLVLPVLVLFTSVEGTCKSARFFSLFPDRVNSLSLTCEKIFGSTWPLILNE